MADGPRSGPLAARSVEGMVKSVIRSAIIVIAASQVLLPISVGAEQGGSIVGPPKVIEGDLLKVGNTVVRLYGIDAPERDQTCRGESREYDCGYIAATGLMDLTAGLSSITCRIEGRTADGTTVASCSDPHGFDLSQQMIHTGWALALPGAEARYHRIEEKSRAAKRGLWKGTVTPPWEWRKANGRE